MDGEEIPKTTVEHVLFHPDRTQREQAWRAIAEREAEDREKLDALWMKKMHVRQQIAHNAGYENYRDYRWRQLLRFDYTPDDCKTFHRAVEQVIVPAASQLSEKRRKLLGVEKLRPWDMQVDPRASEAPRPISDVDGSLRQCIPAFSRSIPN